MMLSNVFQKNGVPMLNVMGEGYYGGGNMLGKHNELCVLVTGTLSRKLKHNTLDDEAKYALLLY